jgi:hypothetical protein
MIANASGLGLGAAKPESVTATLPVIVVTSNHNTLTRTLTEKLRISSGGHGWSDDLSWEARAGVRARVA